MYLCNLFSTFVSNLCAMSKKKERYFVYIRCKPYVKQYLLQNYGAPDFDWPEAISLFKDKDLLREFRRRLIHPSNRDQSAYEGLSMSRYSCEVHIEINKNDFYRYGWALSNTDMVSFSAILEARAKTMMFTYIDLHRSMGFTIAKAIRLFQDRYRYPEDVWSADTIRREYNRHGTKLSSELEKVLSEKINNIVVANLSANGTISHKGLKTYENPEF